MKWMRGFETPILLKDGRAIATLLEAREFLADLRSVRREEPHWSGAVDRIYLAAHCGDSATIADAREQFARALQVEGLL